ncbi:MAG: MATE family efflux transporter [Haloarculaceae archaeon]
MRRIGARERFESSRSAARRLLDRFPALLARLGVVDREMGEEAFGLALTSGTISVVSRFLGAEDRFRPDLAIKQSLWLGLLVSVPLAVTGWLYAEPLVALLTNDPVTVRVFALGVAGFSVSRTMPGALRGAGDTRWQFYGTVVGTYLVRLPIAFLALPVGYAVTVGPFALAGTTLGPFSIAPGMGFGVAAAFVAILAGLYVKAVVNTGRFASGRWVAVARSSRGTRPGDD